MIRYPIGIQTFEKIAEGAYRYVDKTGYVHDIAQRYTYVFLSRPRRFGKSLLASTFHSYFEGRKELFEGLEAGRQEKEWVKYPVLHFDMSMAKHLDERGLHNMLDYMLTCVEEQYGIVKSSDDENLRFSNLIKSCYAKTGQKVVVLIDEYDAPLLDALDDESTLCRNRQVMRNFYSPLKACDAMLRFVFITGITKFSQLSIFSELNNLKNISMMPEYSAICGITQEELETQFSIDIDRMAGKMGLSRVEVIARLRKNYDGYHFSRFSPDIYNPFSLIQSLDAADFSPYWFSSGTPAFLLEMMRKFHFAPQELSEMKAQRQDFDAPTEGMEAITPLLYQSGYITIKGYDEPTGKYILAVPNSEVRQGLMRSLVGYVSSPRAVTSAGLLMMDMQEAFLADDIGKVMELLKVFLSSIPYTDNMAKDYEGHYQALLYVVFSMLCKYVDIEVRTPRGRADIVMNAKNKIYVVEMKLDRSSAFAIGQIAKQGYAERFFITGKPIVKVGVDFDSEPRNIAGWRIID